MYSHSKRMLPRKDEPFRTEFPSQYYSNSSVYSYTPTSSSDCPEHGRSHRRTTLILTISVVFATLGVLSIAGVAAYLGILSKGSNTASQSEESFMLLNSNSKILSEDEGGELFYGNGRSSHRDPSIDPSNTILETKPDSPGSINFDDVDADLKKPHHQHPSQPVTKVRFSQRNSTSIVTSKVNVNVPAFNYEENPPSNNNHDFENPKSSPEPPIIFQTSTTVQQQSQSSQQYPSRYSPSQPGSPIPPPLHRYPPTNSHYATHSDNENDFLTNFDSESSSGQRNPVLTNGVVNFHDLHHPLNETSVKVNQQQILMENNGTAESKVVRRKEDSGLNWQNKPPKQQQQDDLVENGQGLAGNSYESLKKFKNNPNPNNPTPSKNSPVRPAAHGWTMPSAIPTVAQTQFNKPKQMTPTPIYPNIQTSPSSAVNNREQFVPIKPFFKTRTPGPVIPSPSTQSEKNPNLLENHRVHLSFDRISPEFYDQNSWTPLVVRPNMDKKPRLEEAGPSVVTSIPAQSKEMYYQYGDTTSNVNVNLHDPSVNFNLPSTPTLHKANEDKEPLRHALESEHEEHAQKPGDKAINSSITIVSTSIVQDGIERPSPSEDSPAEIEEEENESWDDTVPPAPIPSYTVLIPHIPNPKSEDSPKNVTSAQDSMLNRNFNADIEETQTGQFPSAPEHDESNNSSATGTDREIAKNMGDEDEMIGELILAEGNVKDDEYADGDNDDFQDDAPSTPTKIYKLDSVNIDLHPTSTGPTTTNGKPTNSSSSSEESPIKGPVEPDLQIRTTTDFILSTLGSLNLVKPLPTKSESAVMDVGEESKTEPPLFPPIRSYVGINQPLRPKPSESDESEETKIILLSEPNFIMDGDPQRKFRTDGGEELTPDPTTTSSFNKVLSMMMKFEAENLTNPLANITAQNIHLVVAHANYSAPIAAYLNDTNREQKSIHRDAKIDSRFRDFTEQIPVTLISAGPSTPSFRPSKSNSTVKWNPNKISSVAITNSNSPVYKFVLRKGQSVEELLKEIFHNYTNKGIGNSTHQSIKGLLAPAANIITTRPEVPGSSPGSVDIQFTTKTTTTTTGTPIKAPTTTTLETPATTTTSTSTTTEIPETTPEPPEISTSTTIVLNESENEDCGTNASFRCNSTRSCVSGFARCNGIRDCPDNSDEMGCLCVDFLKSQMLHRKICDGIPDCRDFSDEYQCEWCSPGQYICAGSRACITRDKICDGKRDCPRGDDEGDCVKIGHSGEIDELEDLSPIYHRSGHLMVRKKGIWGKLCVETFSTVLSHWEVKDLARAVCKAKTFSDFETVERVEDEEFNPNEPYYELYDGINQNDNDSAEASYPSSESSPRSSIGFKLSPCKTRVVVKVTCQDLQCGTAPRAFTQAARIVGGSNALAGEWPWQAALYRDGEYQCGATLISSRWLLSAGHCFYHSQDDHWVARLGTLRRGATMLSPYEQVIRLTNIFLHPQYKDVGFINDVSLLRLETEVNFTDFVRPVCLPGKDTNIKDGRMCTVVGWGQLFEVGRVFPDTLQEVQLPLISTSECRKRTVFLPLYKLTDEMFCAGYDRGGRDACLGDSGGPLMCPENDGRWSLYGVTSNGYGCARANRPGVYTKVASYLDWIYEKMNTHDSISYRDKAKPCLGHRCPLGECLEQRRICNGIADCLDSSDERNCTWS